MLKKYICLIFLCCFFVFNSIIADSPPPIRKLVLNIVWVPETKSHIFTFGNVGFLSLESLKKYLGEQPKNTIVEWSPGCLRMENEPLKSAKELDDFKVFLESKGLKFVVIPSG